MPAITMTDAATARSTILTALLLLLIALAGCTHSAPVESQQYAPSRDGLAEALRDYVAAPQRAKPRLWLTVASPDSVVERRPRPLPTFRFSQGGSSPVLADLYADGCPRPAPCPEPLNGRAAWLLDNLNNRVEPLDINEQGLTEGLRRAAELGNQSSVAVDFELPGFEEPARWNWIDADHSYSRAGDFVCGFSQGLAPPPSCWPAASYSRIAIVTPDLEFTYLEATPENLERVRELRAAHPGVRIRVETLWPIFDSGPGFSPGAARVITTFGDTEFCGVFGDLGQFDEHCFAYDAFRSVSVGQRGAGEPWSIGDYASLPLRIAEGVAITIAMGGAAGGG